MRRLLALSLFLVTSLALGQGTITVNHGGTGATTAAGAQTNLGVVPTTRTITTTAPLTGSGDLSANRTIALPVSTTSANGYLSSTDWTTFNAKVPAVRSISTTAPITGGGDLSADRTFAMAVSTTSANGYLSSTDWTTFNAKQPTVSATAPVTFTSNTVALPVSTSSANGYLSSTDWTTFNQLATVSLAGNVSTAAQSFAGDKTLTGSLKTTPCTKSATYPITDTDGCQVLWISTGNTTDVTLTLPAAANNTGRAITIKKVDAGTKKIVVNRAGADTIEGNAAGVTITTFNMGLGAAGRGAMVTLMSDGSNWYYLVYHDMGSFSLSFTGCRASSATIDYTRNGRLVTLSYPRDVGTNCGASSPFTSSTTVDPVLIPARQYFMPTWVENNAAITMGDLKIQTDGTVIIEAALGSFTNGTHGGYYEGTASYPIN